MTTHWPILDPLLPEQRRQVLAAGRRREFARKEVVFHEGDPGDSLHLVQRGHVAVRITTPMGDVATLTVVGPGRTFGELALLDPAARRSATCVALERTETWSLHRDQVDRLRREHPAIDRFFLEMLATYVHRLSEHLVQALYVPADRRVALRLLDLVATYGLGRAIPLTQDDLASLAGTSRATVNRLLGELETDRAVTVARGRITVLDERPVRRRAGTAPPTAP
ncbi:Crp/Fnr family transcriptional regulator [Haloechinothrix sp. LS1_15]|uniref:Crp/Fnr family transcriptional regulator n=1 Tax=Haloechinothrix sp. LS1_15 TaxID=2652248 RepID=UPI002944B1DC|nr:Crp/Fnr family transcriptional regulator [Haloechinothrix sp. LS1_15]MDV6011941.1 Crp/Fnr family transcriptional regulator [Haloechinothrix sp. LS1_15]